MWSWLPAIIQSLLVVIKGLFGIDKPQDVTVRETPSPLPPPAPADVLRDLGISLDATGQTGGAFPTDSLSSAVADGLQHRPDGGGTTRLYPSGATAPDSGERDSDR